MPDPTLKQKAPPFVTGFAAGVVALAIVGFSWGGWVFGSTAKKMADDRASAVTVQYMGKICAMTVAARPDAEAFKAELAKVSTYQRSGVFKDDTKGLVTVPGSSYPNSEIVGACSDLLLQPQPATKT